MSGIELADLATEQNPHLKVILISGYFVAQQVHRRFLRKPFRMRELEAAVRAELACGLKPAELAGAADWRFRAGGFAAAAHPSPVDAAGEVAC